MSGPLRLRDDPNFLRETGCDLAAEARTLPPPDLPALRQRVVRAGRVARLRRIAGPSTLLVILAGLFAHFATPGAPDAARGSAPTSVAVAAEPVTAAAVPSTGTARAELPTPPALHPDAPVRALRDVPSVAPVVVPPTPETPPAVALQAERTGEAVAAAELAATQPSGEGTPAATEGGDLALQHAAFMEAEAARDGGDLDRATQLYAESLDRWPHGAFAAESRLGELRVAVAAGDVDRIVSLSAVLAKDPALAPHRAELVRTRAVALANAGRCTEAREHLRDLSREDRVQVTARCP